MRLEGFETGVVVWLHVHSRARHPTLGWRLRSMFANKCTVTDAPVLSEASEAAWAPLCSVPTEVMTNFVRGDPGKLERFVKGAANDKRGQLMKKASFQRIDDKEEIVCLWSTWQLRSPVYGTTIDDRGKLTQAVSERVADGREAQYLRGSSNSTDFGRRQMMPRRPMCIF
eukprot:1158867-Pelagomonas_calceolata.AAC.9